MQIIFVKRDSPEWDFMWLWLELHAINEGLENPIVAENDGEVWQYIGSFKHLNKTVHEFRHRNHPRTNKLYEAPLPASDTFTDDQIEKSINVK